MELYYIEWKIVHYFEPGKILVFKTTALEQFSKFANFSLYQRIIYYKK